MGTKIKHGRIKTKYNPTPNAAEKRYHEWVRSHGCLVCQRYAAIHHIINKFKTRISKDHMLVVPLCDDHHDSKIGYHRGFCTNDSFKAEYGIDLYEEGVRLNAEYLNK